MDGREQQELNDVALEREIEAALAVDPSPEFLPRVRARIANEHTHAGWIWPASWQWAGVAVVVTVAGMFAVWTLRDPVPAQSDAHVAKTLPVEPAREAPERVESFPESSKPVSAPVVSTARSTRPAAQAQPEIVVSPDEAVALRQLVVAIAARQVDAADIPTLGAESAPLPPIEEIVLEPIELSPIAGLGSE